ncbi:hypothetical protein AgCh_012744 [Apium graveolens]
MAALLVKRFKKMVYNNFKNGRRLSRKGSSSSNSDKRNNRRNTDWKKSRSRKPDKSKERCYNCDGIGHFAADYSDDGINYALMTNASAETDNAELKGSGLGYSDRSNSDKKSGKETEKIEQIKTDIKVKLNKEGTTSAPRSKLITDKSEQVYTKSVNIGSMTQKQLKQKLKDLHMKDKRKRSRKNKNGKGGVNKNGNYVTPPNAPKKTCSNCGSTYHLANSCMKNKKINVVPSKSDFRNRTVRYKP